MKMYCADRGYININLLITFVFYSSLAGSFIIVDLKYWPLKNMQDLAFCEK